MGTARNGRVSKNFGTDDNKIKVRFTDERQARRAAVLMEYLKFSFIDGYSAEYVHDELLRDDMLKAIEILEKIEERHPGALGKES